MNSDNNNVFSNGSGVKICTAKETSINTECSMEYEPAIEECKHCATPFCGEPGVLCGYCHDYTDGKCYSPQSEYYTCLACEHTKLDYFDGSCEYCNLEYHEYYPTKAKAIEARNHRVLKGYGYNIFKPKLYLTKQERKALSIAFCTKFGYMFS